MIKDLFLLLRDAGVRFAEDRATLFAAALAYYTLFSLAPLVVIAIAVAGFFVGRSAALDEVTQAILAIGGPELAVFVQGVVAQVVNATSNATLTLISIGVLIYGASSVFNSLRLSINITWGIANPPAEGIRDLWPAVRSRFLTFMMVFVMGFLLVAVVIADVLFSTVEAAVGGVLPNLVGIIPSINFLVAPAVAFVTFLLIFKTLPDAKSRWRDVAVGALFTAVAFGIGAYVIGRVLVVTGTASIFGAAGALIILLLWVYYSAYIVLYGAELTYLYAARYGQPIEPNESAIYLAERYAARQDEVINHADLQDVRED